MARFRNTNNNVSTFPRPGAAIELIGGYTATTGARLLAQNYADSWDSVVLHFQTATAAYRQAKSSGFSAKTINPSGA